jgi:hypothetical protein
MAKIERTLLETCYANGTICKGNGTEKYEA